MIAYPFLLRLWCALTLLTSLSATAADWQVAKPGWTYAFPRDHGSHPGFKTEWWYFTGNLADAAGRAFGYQLTFFRQGVRPPGSGAGETSRFIVDDFKFGHFAVTDLAEKRFLFTQKLSRGAFGEAGFSEHARPESALVWLEDWKLSLDSKGAFVATAASPEARLNLRMTATKPWIQHGQRGISQKAAGEGRASHYYSGTRLRSDGELSVGGKAFKVTGDSWFDHEWATNQLTPEQVGWDWFSVQLDDGTELMLYQMRLSTGSPDPTSSGTFVSKDGKSGHLTIDKYRLTPVRFWTSRATGARYPVAWDAEVPSLSLTLRIEAAMDDQELVLAPIAYWEGMIRVTGTRKDKPVTGRGYLELTGYSGPLVGLSAPEP